MSNVLLVAMAAVMALSFLTPALHTSSGGSAQLAWTLCEKERRW